MLSFAQEAPSARKLLMGNEVIARGVLGAGVRFAAGYPGAPSSEIVESLVRVAKEAGIIRRVVTREKVATEATAATTFAGPWAFSAMETAGLIVVLGFLTHPNYPGLRQNGDGLVMVYSPM